MRFVIVGCGRAGSRLAQLLSTQGHDVTVIDEDPAVLARFAALTASPAPASRPITLMEGSGDDRAVLLEAQIERADGVAAATGVDAVNVIVARLARNLFHVPRVVARVYEPRKAEIYRRLGIATVSPLAWGVDRMAEVLIHAQAMPVFSMGSGEVNLVLVEAPAFLEGRTVQALTTPHEVQVTAVQRQGRAMLPGPETLLHAGDVLYLAVHACAADRVEALLGHHS